MIVLAYAQRIPRTFLQPADGREPTHLARHEFPRVSRSGYLASLLAQSLRKKGVELEEKREELLSLQDFTEDIIHSMRAG